MTVLFIPLFSVPAMAFEAGGKVYIHFPDGPPALSGLLINFSINPNLAFTLPNPMPICFASGTHILTPDGEVPVETLRPGDLVVTMDHGAQPVRWIGKRHVGVQEQQAEPRLRPVLVPAGALGPDLPRRDLRVSRQHRILIVQHGRDLAEQAFVPAAVLDGRHGIQPTITRMPTALYHLLFDQHEVMFAEGLAAESMHPGVEAMKSLPGTSRAEIAGPGLYDVQADLARPVLKRSDLRDIDRRTGGTVILRGIGPVGRTCDQDGGATRAVTSISNRMASSISRASIMVAAGRATPNAVAN